ncbi:HD domain-containing protein [Dasania sp. GY-MA-18]|uniref:HD domain-containing protein n=1 Tax=Dasania phycosphaerae TaxID=2950436 RepID=A0A9J6RK26_9GAMM|nr:MULTISPECIES: HD domain-containing phosphohydrolase [Dasania]MCR8922407.1 HD domain-containing protein [Dasania sp. GY-MA-18]MCZ0864835.1 HD domain-containing protein [Dasania phycosphaerae]MCZ0868563.1 HD domain-containing protein [Dasania phycosphaerae]
MIFSLPDDLDSDTLAELITAIHESLDELEPALEHLAAHPQDDEQLNALFRNLHTIKGNLRMCMLSPFSDYVHGLEESVSEVREGRLSFNKLFTATYILALDQLRYHLDLLQQQSACDTAALTAIGERFLAIARCGHSPAAQESIQQLFMELETGDINTSHPAICATLADDSEASLPQQQLLFFRASAEQLALKISGNPALYQQMVELAEAALPHLPSDIDSQQLVAAIYMHDLGMDTAAGEQAQALDQHPYTAYHYLLKQQGWQLAAELCLQHHEKWDGSGYPQQLQKKNIHMGAQLIAALDYFFAQQALYPHLACAQASINALIACNRELGLSFSLAVIHALNLAVKQVYLSHKIPPLSAA